MDFFKMFIKRIFYKIPFKLLVLIFIIFLVLLFFHNKAFATTVSDLTNAQIEEALGNALDYVESNNVDPSIFDKYIIASDSNNSNIFHIYLLTEDSLCHVKSDGIIGASTLYGVDINYNTFAVVNGLNDLDNHIRHDVINGQNFWNIRYLNEVYYTNFDLYYINSDQVAFYSNSDFIASDVLPSIATLSEDITDWSFDNLYISLGTLNLYDDINNLKSFSLLISYHSEYNDFDYSIDCSPYLDITNKIITIPKNELLTNFVVENFLLSFDLVVRGYNSVMTYDLGSYSIAISQEQADVINGQNSLDNVNNSINNVNNSINNVNNSINNLDNSINDVNNSINNSNIDNFSSDFSQFGEGFNVQDPSGIDAIFQKLYNAFCTDDVINLTLTIPFVNKTFTISSSNISNNFPQAIKSIVGVFVWGVVGLWVLKDIRNIVDKIGEGNPENVGSDVKKEVL